MLGTISNAVTEAVPLPQLIQGAIAGGIGVAFNASIIALVGLVFWWWKRKIARKEEVEEERGPVLYKNEHDKDCELWRTQHDRNADEKHDQIIRAIGKVEGSVTNVHKRLDAHLEAEAARR
jgi:predicted lipid-binding transport protein (Tim44 family)